MGVWQSNQDWIFKTADDSDSTLIYVVNTNENWKIGEENIESVLGGFPDLRDAIETRPLDEGDSGQKWKKGEPDKEGYYTLQRMSSYYYLTAISSSELKQRSNCISIKCNTEILKA